MTEHNEEKVKVKIKTEAVVENESNDIQNGPPPQDAVPPEVPDTALLHKEIEELRTQSQEYLDGWQRARAELANARRRFEKERAEASRYAYAELMRGLLPVSDDFERALSAIPEDVSGEAWMKGITLIYRKLQQVFESIGVQPIQVQPGDMFDPELHEAVTHEATEEFSSGAVIAELQKGYKLGESVLRPTLVRVAK